MTSTASISTNLHPSPLHAQQSSASSSCESTQPLPLKPPFYTRDPDCPRGAASTREHYVWACQLCDGCVSPIHSCLTLPSPRLPLHASSISTDVHTATQSSANTAKLGLKGTPQPTNTQRVPYMTMSNDTAPCLSQRLRWQCVLHSHAARVCELH